MMITTTTPVQYTGWSLYRCQCCVWTLQMTSFLLFMVSSFTRRIAPCLRFIVGWMHQTHGITFPMVPLQLFQWRQWSRIPTWHSSSHVTEAILVSSRVCGLDRAPTWTESSGSLPKRSLNKAADSKTSHDKRLLQRILLVSLPYFLSYSSLHSLLSGFNISFCCCHLSFHSSIFLSFILLSLWPFVLSMSTPSFYSVHPLFPTTWF